MTDRVRAYARVGMLVALAGLGVAAPVALGSVRHDVVAPPGVIGCEPPPTASDEYPSAALPGTMRYRSSSARVRGHLDHPTQATKASVRAYLPGGRRIDVADPQEYTARSRRSAGFSCSASISARSAGCFAATTTFCGSPSCCAWSTPTAGVRRSSAS